MVLCENTVLIMPFTKLVVHRARYNQISTGRTTTKDRHSCTWTSAWQPCGKYYTDTLSFYCNDYNMSERLVYSNFDLWVASSSNEFQWLRNYDIVPVQHSSRNDKPIFQAYVFHVKFPWSWFNMTQSQGYKEIDVSMSRCHQTSNIRLTLVGNKIVDYSGVVGASPLAAAPTTSSFSI